MNDRKNIIAKVIVFNEGTDIYGQKRKTGSLQRYIEGMLYIYQQRQVQDIRFNDCEYLFLTPDKFIIDANQLEIDGVKYNIIHTIPSTRKYQVLLKKA